MLSSFMKQVLLGDVESYKVFQSTGDVSSIVRVPADVAVRQLNFSLNFDDSVPSALTTYEAVLGEESG